MVDVFVCLFSGSKTLLEIMEECDLTEPETLKILKYLEKNFYVKKEDNKYKINDLNPLFLFIKSMMLEIFKIL